MFQFKFSYKKINMHSTIAVYITTDAIVKFDRDLLIYFQIRPKDGEFISNTSRKYAQGWGGAPLIYHVTVCPN